MKSIAEVLIRMDGIVNECKAKELRIGYFAVMYRLVTLRIKQGVENQEFEDNQRMERLDVLFAKRFIEAYEIWHLNEKTTRSWEVAFEASRSNSYLVLQHLFLGINAHINLDLGIAASETMKGQNLNLIKRDFDQINSILAELVDDVKSNISTISPIFGWLIPLAKGKDEMLLNFSIQLARDGAWKFAGEYHLASDQESQIQNRDKKISRIAEKLINPGKLLMFLIKIVGFAEWKSVSKTMDQLNEIGNDNRQAN